MAVQHLLHGGVRRAPAEQAIQVGAECRDGRPAPLYLEQLLGRRCTRATVGALGERFVTRTPDDLENFQRFFLVIDAGNNERSSGMTHCNERV
jgi:hypothetical protein